MAEKKRTPAQTAPEGRAELDTPETADEALEQPSRDDERELRELRELRRPRGGEAAVIVSALLDLHRTVGAGSQGATVRGRKPDGTAPRYLEAARAVGDALVTELLGPETASPR